MPPCTIPLASQADQGKASNHRLARAQADTAASPSGGAAMDGGLLAADVLKQIDPGGSRTALRRRHCYKRISPPIISGVSKIPADFKAFGGKTTSSHRVRAVNAPG
jgi:hypothetical protein